MAAKRASTPRKGSERVKAWLYTVINPLVEALYGENTLLETRNITWRYLIARPEFILVTRDHIPHTSKPNYDDFLRGYEDIKPSIEGRDGKVHTLYRVAQSCWEHLTRLQQFDKVVGQRLEEWMTEGQPYPGGAVPKDEFWLLIAEHVMNNLEDLPNHYANRQFWLRFRKDFHSQHFAPWFLELESAAVGAQKANIQLIEALDNARSQLCEQYDIPAAPM